MRQVSTKDDPVLKALAAFVQIIAGGAIEIALLGDDGYLRSAEEVWDRREQEGREYADRVRQYVIERQDPDELPHCLIFRMMDGEVVDTTPLLQEAEGTEEPS